MKRELKEKELEGVKLTESEEKKLKEKLQNEILNHSWKSNHLTWMGKDQKRLAEKFNMEELKHVGEVHQEYNKETFPHHILGGETWMEFHIGYLVENPEVEKKIRKFYEQDYEMYLKTVENLESDFPIFVIGDYCPKLSGVTPLPLIVNYKDNKKVIVLYINK